MQSKIGAGCRKGRRWAIGNRFHILYTFAWSALSTVSACERVHGHGSTDLTSRMRRPRRADGMLVVEMLRELIKTMSYYVVNARWTGSLRPLRTSPASLRPEAEERCNCGDLLGAGRYQHRC